MDTYSLFREIADSWVLLALVLVFLGVVIWAFRPGSRKVHEDVA
ncbi:MAG: CcoQ/FixQ family Cbb3-type cytochrome c oxidase assembly chaperone, partial [Rhodobacteraceae bacterium]|nr:CcoQ/FixQ family Cbb3-type cytochrome c oxidase assembly chaperone [Paracoccaceae bacterium]